MAPDPRLKARIALLEQAARREPTVVICHNLARLRLDCGDAAGAASACRKAVELGGQDVPIEPVIKASDAGIYSPQVQAARARALMEQGFITTAVISQLARALVAIGDGAGVRSLIEYERFHTCDLYGPARDLPLRRIANIFLESPTWYGEPTDRAIREASRYDAIKPDSEIAEIAALARVLRQAAQSYIARIAADVRGWHPFTASIPGEFSIEAWGVISGRTGYHQSHIHPRAWASGVLYLVAPEAAADTAARTGWLRIGPPRDLTGAAEAGWQERWIQPAPGLLVMMPGYFTHETAPMERDEERILVAFDIAPQYSGARS